VATHGAIPGVVAEPVSNAPVLLAVESKQIACDGVEEHGSAPAGLFGFVRVLIDDPEQHRRSEGDRELDGRKG
jgi:hypothetical protein